MTLSRWFRDYLYVPLGGNRRGPFRTYLNLMIVFLLCGLWHGANWTFIVWGAWHGVFLVIERLGLGPAVERTWRPLRHAYTLAVVMIGWVFFRADTLTQAGAFLRSMFGIGGQSLLYPVERYATPTVLTALLVGVFLATLPAKEVTARIARGTAVPVAANATCFACWRCRCWASRAAPTIPSSTSGSDMIVAVSRLLFRFAAAMMLLVPAIAQLTFGSTGDDDNRAMRAAPKAPASVEDAMQWPRGFDGYLADHFGLWKYRIRADVFLRWHVFGNPRRQAAAGRNGRIFLAGGKPPYRSVLSMCGATAMTMARARSMVEAWLKAAAKLPASKVFVIPSASALYTQDLPGWVERACRDRVPLAPT